MLVGLVVKDTSGRPVPGADVVLDRAGRPRVWGRTDGDGRLTLATGEVPAR